MDKWFAIMMLGIFGFEAVVLGFESHEKGQAKQSCFEAQAKSTIDLRCGNLK